MAMRSCFLVASALILLQHTCLCADDALPNIVLVMADDQGWGDMAYNGHPDLKTPNFDAMAKQAVRFDQFHSAAPVCSPTRGSVMTGRTPNRSGDNVRAIIRNFVRAAIRNSRSCPDRDRVATLSCA